MTLVIASVHEGQVHLVADTLITYEDRLGRRPYHSLKILAFSPTTVLAFSGDHERAIQIYFDVCAMDAHKLGLIELVELVNQLRSQGIAPLNSEPPDFLIASVTPEPAIYRINDLGVSLSLEDSWIGNQKAAAIVAKSACRIDSPYSNSAFHEVVRSGNFTDVGGHVVHMRGNHEGFKFIPSMRLVSPSYVPVEGWQTVDFGSAQTGGYGFTTITPCEAGRNGYGVFFFQGAFGLFFSIDSARRSCETLKAYANTSTEFMSIIEQELNFKLEHCGSLS